jgi:flagellar biosynthesis/type III secretory pathway protein FliH
MNPNTVPRISYDKSTKKLIDEYKKAYKEILTSVVELRNIPDSNNLYQQQASLLRQIEVILTNLNEVNKAWCEEEIRNAFQQGQAYAVLTSGGAATLVEATQGVQFSLLAQNTVETLIQDTYEDLLTATNNTSKNLKKLVRQVVGDVIRQRSIQQYGRNTIKNDITNQLTKKGLSKKVTEEGFVGIVDKAGRRWDINRYADMVTRTKLNQAHVEGVRVEGVGRGIDTAIISTHNAEDECNYFEGMIISLNGLTEGLLTYDDLRYHSDNKIFHPNCQHKVHLVKLDLLPKAVLEKHERKVQALPIANFKKKIKPLDKIKTPDTETVKGFSEQLTLAL